MKDLIIGCSDNYDWDTLKYWVNSIKMTGFLGDIVLIVFRASKDTIEKLVENGVNVIALSMDSEGNANHTSQIPVHVERFFHIYNYLRLNPYRWVVTTDVKDIVFQKNPIEFIMQESPWMDTYLIFSSESLKYEDEPWGFNNVLEGYGPFWQSTMAEKTIYNVGILAGHGNYIRDLCQEIFLMSVNRPIGIVDQASFNIIIDGETYKKVGTYLGGNSKWACNLGTTMDPNKIESFRPNLLDFEPIVVGDEVQNRQNDPYYIVHQYDRVPGLREKIYQKFGGE